MSSQDTGPVGTGVGAKRRRSPDGGDGVDDASHLGLGLTFDTDKRPAPNLRLRTHQYSLKSPLSPRGQRHFSSPKSPTLKSRSPRGGRSLFCSPRTLPPSLRYRDVTPLSSDETDTDTSDVELGTSLEDVLETDAELEAGTETERRAMATGQDAIVGSGGVESDDDVDAELTLPRTDRKGKGVDRREYGSLHVPRHDSGRKRELRGPKKSLARKRVRRLPSSAHPQRRIVSNESVRTIVRRMDDMATSSVDDGEDALLVSSLLEDNTEGEDRASPLPRSPSLSPVPLSPSPSSDRNEPPSSRSPLAAKSHAAARRRRHKDREHLADSFRQSRTRRWTLSHKWDADDSSADSANGSATMDRPTSFRLLESLASKAGFKLVPKSPKTSGSPTASPMRLDKDLGVDVDSANNDVAVQHLATLSDLDFDFPSPIAEVPFGEPQYVQDEPQDSYPYQHSSAPGPSNRVQAEVPAKHYLTSDADEPQQHKRVRMDDAGETAVGGSEATKNVHVLSSEDEVAPSKRARIASPVMPSAPITLAPSAPITLLPSAPISLLPVRRKVVARVARRPVVLYRRPTSQSPFGWVAYADDDTPLPLTGTAYLRALNERATIQRRRRALLARFRQRTQLEKSAKPTRAHRRRASSSDDEAVDALLRTDVEMADSEAVDAVDAVLATPLASTGHQRQPNGSNKRASPFHASDERALRRSCFRASELKIASKAFRTQRASDIAVRATAREARRAEERALVAAILRRNVDNVVEQYPANQTWRENVAQPADEAPSQPEASTSSGSAATSRRTAARRRHERARLDAIVRTHRQQVPNRRSRAATAPPEEVVARGYRAFSTEPVRVPLSDPAYAQGRVEVEDDVEVEVEGAAAEAEVEAEVEIGSQPQPAAPAIDVDAAPLPPQAPVVGPEPEEEPAPPAYEFPFYPVVRAALPAHLRTPRVPPPPPSADAPLFSPPTYLPTRYSRRTPSPPPPYNALTDRDTVIAPVFQPDGDEVEEVVAPVARRPPPLRLYNYADLLHDHQGDPQADREEDEHHPHVRHDQHEYQPEDGPDQHDYPMSDNEADAGAEVPQAGALGRIARWFGLW